MALVLLQNLTNIGLRQSTVFQADGGVEPYVYSVEAGGVGGTIGSSSGTYIAPSDSGYDTIKVVDANLDEVTSTILVQGPLQLFCDIIQKEMDLENDQVYLWDQKVIIPKDYRLYIAVEVLSCKPFANNNEFQSNGTSLSSVNMQATLSVDIFSRGPSARDRKEEVILALMSNYAQSQQEANSFYVGKLSPTFTNLSNIDGAAIPYRFNISVNIQYFVIKSKAVPYYDDFENVEVTTEA